MGLFSKKTTTQVTDTRNPETKAYDQFISNFVQQYGGQYKPQAEYGGKFTAGMSPYEQQGMNLLQGYIDQPNISPELAAARKQFADTTAGG